MTHSFAYENPCDRCRRFFKEVPDFESFRWITQRLVKEPAHLFACAGTLQDSANHTCFQSRCSVGRRAADRGG